MSDLNRWHLDVKEGRQRWIYSPPEEGARVVQNVVDRYLLGLDTSAEFPDSPPAFTPLEAARKGAHFYAGIQSEDGHWAHDYGGPMFLLPGLIICCYITGHQLRPEQKFEMIRYLRSRQNGDGGWGLHIEATSGIFGTGLNYVALRLLGLPANDPDIARARRFLLANGGCSWIPQWGKVWFACLGIYSWDGINAIPPELWGLPYWLPFHPGRWWCHCRVVYLPMGYLYGLKATAKETPLILSYTALQEIYVSSYDLVDWKAARDQCSPLDRYKFAEKPKALDYIFAILNAYEKVHNPHLRAKALAMCLDHIRFEDRFTKWICIGPVNKAFNMLSIFFAEGPDSENFKNHQARVDDYLWLAADGMKMQGYNGSQLWDTAFSVQALVAADLRDKAVTESLKRAYTYIDLTQVPEDVPNLKHYYRHISKGAWPFSTRDHGWPIADCTGEGLIAALSVRPLDGFRSLDEQRYCDAVNVVLSLQNSDGGWATYENQRGPELIEKLNPAEIFYGIMVDYSYTELSSSAIVGLSRFREVFPNHRADEIKRAIARGIEFVKSLQRDDGSWYGCWGVCFLYGTWFGVRALTTVGETLATSDNLRRACNFVLSKQQADGGWGETFESCTTWEYQQNPRSQVVGTAWALLSLLFAGYPDRAPLQRGIDFLMRRQLPDGNWAQEDISGVFNSTCSISYSGYKNIFPIWALGLFAKKFPSTPAPKARM